MTNSPLRRSHKSGLPPGTVVHIGDQASGPAVLSVIHFDEITYVEKVVESVEEALSYLAQPGVTWINFAGVHDTERIESLGHALGLHPLVLEDIANTNQRPKVESYDDYFYIVVKMLEYLEEDRSVGVEQVSLILGQNYLVSFQEDNDDVFNPVRVRLRSAAARLRKLGSDGLTYVLLDAIVDHYFVILERIGDEVEDVEEQVTGQKRAHPLQEVYRLRREVIALRRAVWPLREVIAALQHSDSSLIQPGTVIYLRDVYDHTIQIMDTIEGMRDILSGLLDVHLSVLSNRMNEIIKVLTIFSTIFIPLTFLAGVYGMNFRYFPEITWRYGYLFFWLICAVIAALMLAYFRRKHWL